MISELNLINWSNYCREPIENIKGYNEALNNPGRYDCHHINELTFTKDQLKKMNMYYHRPASELVIMSHSEHRRWHILWNGDPIHGNEWKISGELNHNYKGDDCSDHHKKYRDTLYSTRSALQERRRIRRNNPEEYKILKEAKLSTKNKKKRDSRKVGHKS